MGGGYKWKKELTIKQPIVPPLKSFGNSLSMSDTFFLHSSSSSIFCIWNQ